MEGLVGISRRNLIRKGTIAAGAVWVAPTVLTITPAAAQSGGTYRFVTEMSSGGTCALSATPGTFTCPGLSPAWSSATDVTTTTDLAALGVSQPAACPHNSAGLTWTISGTSCIFTGAWSDRHRNTTVCVAESPASTSLFVASGNGNGENYLQRVAILVTCP